jgi:hypothetical protein
MSALKSKHKRIKTSRKNPSQRKAFTRGPRFSAGLCAHLFLSNKLSLRGTKQSQACIVRDCFVPRNDNVYLKISFDKVNYPARRYLQTHTKYQKRH